MSTLRLMLLAALILLAITAAVGAYAVRLEYRLDDRCYRAYRVAGIAMWSAIAVLLATTIYLLVRP